MQRGQLLFSAIFSLLMLGVLLMLYERAEGEVISMRTGSAFQYMSGTRESLPFFTVYFRPSTTDKSAAKPAANETEITQRNKLEEPKAVAGDVRKKSQSESQQTKTANKSNQSSSQQAETVHEKNYSASRTVETLKPSHRKGKRRGGIQKPDAADGNPRYKSRSAVPRKGKKVKKAESPDHPDKRYIVHRYGGRLGNVLFQFAALSCIAELNNMTFAVDEPGREQSELRYPAPALPYTPTSPREHWAKIWVKHNPVEGCAYLPNIVSLEPKDSHHYLRGYLQSWRYFEPCKARLKEVPIFTNSVMDKAVGITAKLRRQLPNTTLIGVHVRMEDYLRKSEVSVGRKTAPPDYYHRAMEYFRARFHNVTFVIMASDPQWFRDHIKATDVIFLGRGPSPAVDMEVLSRLDHLIISVGTYGWWAGYRNNGTVVAYRDFYVPDSKYGLKMDSCIDDYFYPGWVLM